MDGVFSNLGFLSAVGETCRVVPIERGQNLRDVLLITSEKITYHSEYCVADSEHSNMSGQAIEFITSGKNKYYILSDCTIPSIRVGTGGRIMSAWQVHCIEEVFIKSITCPYCAEAVEVSAKYSELPVGVYSTRPCSSGHEFFKTKRGITLLINAGLGETELFDMLHQSICRQINGCLDLSSAPSPNTYEWDVFTSIGKRGHSYAIDLASIHNSEFIFNNTEFGMFHRCGRLADPIICNLFCGSIWFLTGGVSILAPGSDAPWGFTFSEGEEADWDFSRESVFDYIRRNSRLDSLRNIEGPYQVRLGNSTLGLLLAGLNNYSEDDGRTPDGSALFQIVSQTITAYESALLSEDLDIPDGPTLRGLTATQVAKSADRSTRYTRLSDATRIAVHNIFNLLTTSFELPSGPPRTRSGPLPKIGDKGLKKIINIINNFHWVNLTAQGAAIITDEIGRKFWSVTFEGKEDREPLDKNTISTKAYLQQVCPSNATVKTVQIIRSYNGTSFITRWQVRYYLHDDVSSLQSDELHLGCVGAAADEDPGSTSDSSARSDDHEPVTPLTLVVEEPPQVIRNDGPTTPTVAPPKAPEIEDRETASEAKVAAKSCNVYTAKIPQFKKKVNTAETFTTMLRKNGKKNRVTTAAKIRIVTETPLTEPQYVSRNSDPMLGHRQQKPPADDKEEGSSAPKKRTLSFNSRAIRLARTISCHPNRVCGWLAGVKAFDPFMVQVCRCLHRYWSEVVAYWKAELTNMCEASINDIYDLVKFYATGEAASKCFDSCPTSTGFRAVSRFLGKYDDLSSFFNAGSACLFCVAGVKNDIPEDIVGSFGYLEAMARAHNKEMHSLNGNISRAQALRKEITLVRKMAVAAVKDATKASIKNPKRSFNKKIREMNINLNGLLRPIHSTVRGIGRLLKSPVSILFFTIGVVCTVMVYKHEQPVDQMLSWFKSRLTSDNGKKVLAFIDKYKDIVFRLGTSLLPLSAYVNQRDSATYIGITCAGLFITDELIDITTLTVVNVTIFLFKLQRTRADKIFALVVGGLIAGFLYIIG